MGKNKQPATEPDTIPEVEASQPKKAYIVTKSTPCGSHVYAPGQTIEVPEDAELPANVMPLENSGVSTGPHYFALVEFTRNGITLKPGDVWPWPFSKEAPPANLCAPLSERDQFDFISVDGINKAKLHRKASVDPGKPPAA